MVLVEQECVTYKAGAPPLTREEAEEIFEEIPLWTLESDRIEREFKFKDFREAMEFVNKVAEVANEQDHHPDIHISYSRVRIELSTHKIGGLSRNDFIVAARIDAIAD